MMKAKFEDLPSNEVVAKSMGDNPGAKSHGYKNKVPLWLPLLILSCQKRGGGDLYGHQ